MKIKKLCVFCGSSIGKNPKYRINAQLLADKLVEKNIDLVYGGGNVGIMGILASRMIEKKGNVFGIIPEKIHSMVKHIEITELLITKDMHARKAKMYELSDGFIALPGGIGTLEELSEILTWYQLGYHQKPIAILNIDGFYDSLINFLENMISEGFLRKEQYECLIIDNNIDSILNKMECHKSVILNKWT
jgi:uncharacterized protein (TIGR00730 family)